MGSCAPRSISASCDRGGIAAAPVVHHSKPAADFAIDEALVRSLLREQQHCSRWSIVPWLSGSNADLCEPRADQGERLAAFLCALHRPAPADVPVNPYRGVPLRERAEQIAERIHRLERETTLLNDDVVRIYRAAIEAPIDVAPTWLHGDLHGGNLLVDDGVISGVIDWGDMGSGDRATDLATPWINLGNRKARERAMRACNGVSDATWLRAKGWAVFFGVTLGTSGLAGDARHALMARRTLERVVAGP